MLAGNDPDSLYLEERFSFHCIFLHCGSVCYGKHWRIVVLVLHLDLKLCIGRQGWVSSVCYPNAKCITRPEGKALRITGRESLLKESFV